MAGRRFEAALEQEWVDARIAAAEGAVEFGRFVGAATREDQGAEAVAVRARQAASKVSCRASSASCTEPRIRSQCTCSSRR